MTQQLSSHFEGSEPCRKLWLQRKSRLTRLRTAKIEQIRKDWNASQGVEDMDLVLGTTDCTSGPWVSAVPPARSLIDQDSRWLWLEAPFIDPNTEPAKVTSSK